MAEFPWWADHINLTIVADFMNRQDESINNIIYMLEKPWKYDETYELAKAETELPSDLQER